MTLWNGRQHIGTEPNPTPVPLPRLRLARACCRCGRQVLLPLPRYRGAWEPVTCRRCAWGEQAGEAALRLVCAAGSALGVIAWVWLLLRLGGAR